MRKTAVCRVFLFCKNDWLMNWNKERSCLIRINMIKTSHMILFCHHLKAIHLHCFEMCTDIIWPLEGSVFHKNIRGLYCWLSVDSCESCLSSHEGATESKFCWIKGTVQAKIKNWSTFVSLHVILNTIVYFLGHTSKDYQVRGKLFFHILLLIWNKTLNQKIPSLLIKKRFSHKKHKKMGCFGNKNNK